VLELALLRADTFALPRELDAFFVSELRERLIEL
jgi:hypothetical protein